jgi:hypothetical protein
MAAINGFTIYCLSGTGGGPSSHCWHLWLRNVRLISSGGALLLCDYRHGKVLLFMLLWFQRSTQTGFCCLLRLRASSRQSPANWAATSMARLWRDQGKRDEAHDFLALVYGWFTAGFDTLDLKEAKALLSELHA